MENFLASIINIPPLSKIITLFICNFPKLYTIILLKIIYWLVIFSLLIIDLVQIFKYFINIILFVYISLTCDKVGAKNCNLHD